MLTRILATLADKYVTEKLLQSEAFHKFVQKTHDTVKNPKSIKDMDFSGWSDKSVAKQGGEKMEAVRTFAALFMDEVKNRDKYNKK
ncbi:hypothetical protein SAICODRAFT_16574 [Saitoella complicata NRRL Y-17804]|nr:uncharacterized protein SAICODRAFT_16574 [Saitoella complicata NRRL Y-17804]ODQ56575.1 hypothetical protein SAICODRAFT_16574 [Saitoella complicata NRRL Y-17804]